MQTRQLTLGAMLGAAYVVLTLVTSAFGIAFGPIQFRLSEALCLLPFFFPATAWGLFAGCLLSNLLSPYGALDIIFGSFATLLAAAWTRRCRRKWLAPLPPVVCNAVIIGALITVQQVPGELFWGTFLYNALTIGLGEALSCYVLGGLLLRHLPKTGKFSA